MEKRVVCGICKIDMKQTGNLGFDDTDVSVYECPCDGCENVVFISWSK